MTDVEKTAGSERAELEAQRDFLLRSLDDLDAEHRAGGIDDDSYQRLHDDYTARAAAVIRALRDGLDTRPPRARTSTRRRVLTVGGVVAFAALAGVALATALGARLPGGTSSGNTGATTKSAAAATTRQHQVDLLKAAIARNPQDVTSRMLLARLLEADGNLAGALAQYDQVTKLDSSNADAEAQAGRILYLTAQAAPANAADLVTRSRARLDHAIALNPQFPDAHFFRAIVFAQEFQDFTDAQNDLQHYLVLAPSGPFADQARQLLVDVTNAMRNPPSTTAPANRKATP